MEKHYQKIYKFLLILLHYILLIQRHYPAVLLHIQYWFYFIINVFSFQCVFGTLNLHIKICSSKSYVCFSWLSGSRKSLKPTNHYQVNNSAASCLLPQHTFNPYISVLLLQKYQQSPSLSASLTNVLKNAKHIEHMFVLCYNTYSYFRYHYFSIW